MLTISYLCEIECLEDSDCPGVEICPTGEPPVYCTGGPYNCRDVDWYRFEVCEPSMIEYCITADFPVYAELYDPRGHDVCGPCMHSLGAR